MAIDDRVEDPLRRMLGHAIRRELDELVALVASVPKEVYDAGLELCQIVCGYIVLDVCQRWPLEDDDVLEVARSAAESAGGLPMTETEINAYLSRVVFGFEARGTVFPAFEQAIKVPLFVTASLLSQFSPGQLQWWEYLNSVWNGIEIADQTEPIALPALQYRIRAAAAAATRQPGRY